MGAFLFGLVSAIMLGLGLSGEMPVTPRQLSPVQTSEPYVSPTPTPGPLELPSIGVVTPCDPGKNNEDVRHCLEP